MRRYLVILIIIIFIRPLIALDDQQYGLQSAGINLQSEYRKDTIDFEERERDFYRQKASILFSKKSSFNYTQVRTADDENKYTWSLVLKDISPVFSILGGYFYVNFGSGLLIGRRSPYNPDLFSRKENRDIGSYFTPCVSGNPLFAFRGLSLSYKEKFGGAYVSVDSFYSSIKRYIDSSSYEEGGTGSSISSLNNYDERDNRRSEPVENRTHGTALAINLLESITLQLHYVYTDLSAYSGRRIYWNYDDGEGERTGTSSIMGSGFFLKYSEEHIAVFCERNIIIKKILSEENREKVLYGQGVIFGMEFKYPLLSLSIIKKNTHSLYDAPYESSMGNSYPEEGWFFDNEIRLYQRFSLGSSFTSEQKKSAVTNDLDINRSRKESVYMNYSYKYISKMKFSAKRLISEDSGKKVLRDQGRSDLGIGSCKMFQAGISGIIQKQKDTDNSFYYSTSCSFNYKSIFKLILSYGRAAVSENNYIYAVMSPVKNSNISGIMVKETSDLAALKIDIRALNVFFSSRYLQQFKDKKCIKKRLEIYGSGQF